MIIVNQMYQLTKSENKPLLSDYDSDFWADYVSNFSSS